MKRNTSWGEVETGVVHAIPDGPDIDEVTVLWDVDDSLGDHSPLELELLE